MPVEPITHTLRSAEESTPVLRQCQLRDLDRGDRNLCHLADSLGAETLGTLSAALGRILPRCADPDMALNNLERFLATPGGRERLPTLTEPRGRALETLLQLFGASQFLSDTLIGN